MKTNAFPDTLSRQFGHIKSAVESKAQQTWCFKEFQEPHTYQDEAKARLEHTRVLIKSLDYVQEDRRQFRALEDEHIEEQRKILKDEEAQHLAAIAVFENAWQSSGEVVESKTVTHPDGNYVLVTTKIPL